MVHIGNDWDTILAPEFASESYLRLREFLKREYATKRIYPDMYDIFNALKYTAYKDVKCVILGQDPYHGEGQAHGLSFSVRQGVQPPPSLVNIFKEIYDDLGIDNRGGSGDLEVLSACNRMNLISYAQISSRLGGGIVLVIASIVFSMMV